MSVNLGDSPAVMAFVVIPREVIWSYCSFAVVFAIGLAAIFVRGDWQKARGLDKLILLGPVFYSAPLAAFGTEHFTLTQGMVPMIPAWIPWHTFWIYFVGACFIAAALSMVTGIQARLAASLVSLALFLFVALMHFPGWMRDPHNRFALTVALREISFSGGALALAASLTPKWRERQAQVSAQNQGANLGHRQGGVILATIARYFVAVPVLFFSVEQFLHGDHVPGVPLRMVTPAYVFGHAIWTYVAAAVYAVAGILLLIGKKTRLAAIWLGLTVLFVELVVYVPIAVVERASLEGLNYMADTLMFCGAVLMLARAMPASVDSD